MAGIESGGGSVSDLMEDLADVSKWHSLGTHLGLTASQLDVIEQEIPAGVDAVQRRKGRVLDTWAKGKTDDPSRRDIVSALMKMGEHSVADEMRRKYSGSVPVNTTVSEAVIIARRNQQQIKGKFLKLQMLVCEKLQAMRINMQKFLYFVKGLFPCVHCIPASKKIYVVFEALTCNGLWDYLNYSPLHEIGKAFGRSNKDIINGLEDYVRELAGYLAVTKLADHIASIRSFPEEAYNDVEPSAVSKDQHNFKKLSMKLKANITEKSVKYIIELWENVSKYLCLPSLTYLLDQIREGCISVTWLVPPSAIPAIVLGTGDPESANVFARLGIIKIEMDDLCLYEEQEPIMEMAVHVHDLPFMDSILKQFSDSHKQVQKEASQDISESETVKVKKKEASSVAIHLSMENIKLREELARAQQEANKLKNQLELMTLDPKLSEKVQSTLALKYVTNSEGGSQIRRRESMPSQQPDLQLTGRLRSVSGMTFPWKATFNSSGQLTVTEDDAVSVFDNEGRLMHRLKMQYSGVRLSPNGIAIDDRDFMYISDSNACKLFKVCSSGKIVKAIGGSGSGPGQFATPDGIALRNKKLYVCDSENHRIQIFSCNLDFISTFGNYGSSEGEFSFPRDLAFDEDGRMYVVEHGNDRVQVFSSSGAFLSIIGKPGSGQGELNGPVGICVNQNTVYITESGVDCVSVFTTSGDFITSFGGWGEFDDPHGITMDRHGFLYVCDYLNDCIQVF